MVSRGVEPGRIIPGCEVTLSERDGKTYVRVEQLHDSVQSRDAHIGSGMEAGMREALDRLEEFVSSQPN